MTAAALKSFPLLLALAGSAGGDIAHNNAPSNAASRSHWVEVKWPFPIDQWGTGRAFQCNAETCGTTANIYVRPKIGFCNCARGVYDDAELDRVGDMMLIGPQFSGMTEGEAVTVGWMQGRSRVFLVSGPYQPPRAAAAVAFNDKCDVMVATVTADADLARAEHEALQFLNSDAVLNWARNELGSEGG